MYGNSWEKDLVILRLCVTRQRTFLTGLAPQHAPSFIHTISVLPLSPGLPSNTAAGPNMDPPSPPLSPQIRRPNPEVVYGNNQYAQVNVRVSETRLLYLRRTSWDNAQIEHWRHPSPTFIGWLGYYKPNLLIVLYLWPRPTLL